MAIVGAAGAVVLHTLITDMEAPRDLAREIREQQVEVILV